MSVKVNLLPSDRAEREAAGRARGYIGLGFVALAGGLGVLYFLGTQNVTAAEGRVAAEQDTLTALQADLAGLEEFDALSVRASDANEVIQAAMGGEVSYAGILQDVAAVMPPSADLESLTISTGQVINRDLGDTRQAIGRLAMGGRSIEGHAPGLERFLLEFDKIAGFSDAFFTSSIRGEVEGLTLDIIDFDVELDLGPDTLTARYVDGLPEVLR